MHANTGTGCRVDVTASARPTRSVLKNLRSTSHSTAIAANHGNTMVAPKRANDNPLALNASRLVRLETGRSREAEFARWVHAYTCGFDRSRSCATVAKTTGVSSTTVASRLSTAVTVLATANTSARSLTGLPREPVATQVPAASNSPKRSHRLARTRTAARKPMVGARLFASAPAWLSGRTPSSNSKPAAGTATRASGHPQGRTTAQASVATRSRPASVSAMGLGTVRESLSRRGPVRRLRCGRPPGDPHCQSGRSERRCRVD